ncbi:hypothetical protein BDL97_06G090300 [Sphagnum fallax]|nr:hypothetical protein BDL97_06G090300 [Sphagnum fallax]
MCIATRSCSATYSVNSATSNLCLHLKLKHNITRESLDGAILDDPMQTTFAKDGSYLAVHNVLDNDTTADIMTKVVEWVIDMKQSFSSVEAPSFKAMTKALNRFWPGCSRATLIRAINDEMTAATVQFRQVVESIPGRVAITCDGWSARSMRGFFVITLHWINQSWNLRDCVLEFNLEEGWHLRCVCHIIHRAVVDSEMFIKPKLEKLRTMIKTIRLSPKLRAGFQNVQVRLGKKESETKEVPRLDVENHWNTTFLMIDAAYTLQDAFESLSNIEEHCGKIVTLTSLEWRCIKAFKDFLAPAFEMTVVASGSSYATLSNQPLIYESLKRHCDDTISGTLVSGFTTLDTKKAAEALKEKLEKYRDHSTGTLPMLALALDPEIPKSDQEIVDFSVQFRLILSESSLSKRKTKTILVSARRDLVRGPLSQPEQERDDIGKEIDDFFQFTKAGDDRCHDAVAWWATIGHERFPRLSLLARDTLMCMGSSVPSESAFSDSGDVAILVRSRLSDRSVETTMKLRSWKRLFKKMQIQ